jgi:hypothetical protein
MPDESDRQVFSNHVAGLTLAASKLVRMMDRPGMTIELLRSTQAAGIFREHTEDLSRFLTAQMLATPEGVLTSEEKVFLQHWLAEKDKHH